MKKLQIKLLYKFLSIITERVKSRRLIAKKIALGSLLITTAYSCGEEEITCYAAGPPDNRTQQMSLSNITYNDSLKDDVSEVTDTLYMDVASSDDNYFMYRILTMDSTEVLRGGTMVREEVKSHKISLEFHNIAPGYYKLYTYFKADYDAENNNEEMDLHMAELKPYYIKVN